MKTMLSIPRRQETLTFEYMAGRHTFETYVTHLRETRRQQRHQGKASPLREKFNHEAQKILCFACVSFAIVLLFAVLDFAG